MATYKDTQLLKQSVMFEMWIVYTYGTLTVKYKVRIVECEEWSWTSSQVFRNK